MSQVNDDIKISELPTGELVANSTFIADDVDGLGYVTASHIFSDLVTKLMTNFAYTQIGLQTTNKTVLGAVNEVQAVMGKVLTATLEAGETSLTLTDNAITVNASYDFYGIYPTNISLSSGSMTLTFDEQEEDVEIKVVIF